MAIVHRKAILFGPDKLLKAVRKNPAPARRTLTQIREEIVAEGARLLSLDEIRREVAERRGSHDTKRR